MKNKQWLFAHLLGLSRTDAGDDGGSDDDTGSQGDDGGTDNDAEQSKDEGRKAPWDAENFDSDRAAALLRNLDADLKKAQAERDEFKQKHDDAENAKLSDLQRAEKERDDNAKLASDLSLENARLKALIKHGLDEEDLEFIGGQTPDEIATRAAKYAARHVQKDAAPPSKRPTTRLRGGSDPNEEPDETDPRKLAEQIPRT